MRVGVGSDIGIGVGAGGWEWNWDKDWDWGGCWDWDWDWAGVEKCRNLQIEVGVGQRRAVADGRKRGWGGVRVKREEPV